MKVPEGSVSARVQAELERCLRMKSGKFKRTPRHRFGLLTGYTLQFITRCLWVHLILGGVVHSMSRFGRIAMHFGHLTESFLE